MAVSKAIWAIDIGQCALKAIHARSLGDQIEIDQYVVIPHEQILSQPDADEPGLVRKTLQKFVAQFPQIKDPIVIAVPGHRSFARFSKLPPVEPKKIPDIVLYEATQQIPFGIDEVVWDYHVFQAPGSPDLEVGIFAIKKSILAQYLGYFQELKLNPSIVQTAPIALYNAFEREGLLGAEASVIADVGAQNTNFLISENYRLWLRNIPLGGNNFTEALQKSFKLNFAKAEELKCTAATSKYARAVFQSMRPVFSDLAAEFQRSVGFYTSVNRESQMTQLFALGSAFRLPGLLKFLQQNLGMNVKKVETFGKVRLAGNINEADFTENILSLGVAYGLALQGLGQAKVNTDLMPPEIIRQVSWQKKGFWFMGAAACLLLATLGVWGKYLSVASAIEGDKNENNPAVESKIQQYNQLKSEYQSNSDFANAESKLTTDMKKIAENRLLLPELIATLTSVVPVQPGLDTAMASKDYKSAAVKTPRGKRTQIFLDSIQLTYVPNLTEKDIEAMDAAGRAASNLRTMSPDTGNMGMGGMGMGGMGMGAPGMGPPGPGMMPGGPGMMPGGPGMGPPGMGMGGPGMMPGGPGMMPGGPGMGPGGMGGSGGVMRRSAEGGAPVVQDGKKAFLVTLIGTTPHASAPEFLTKSLMENLSKYGKKQAAKSKKGFWIDHVNLVSCQPLFSEAKIKEFQAMGRSGQQMPKDPLTDEPLVDDSTFVVTCVVNVGTPPADPDDAAKDKKPEGPGGPVNGQG